MASKTGEEQGSKHSNATTWKKGYCPNKKGRPKKRHSITERMRAMFAENPEKKDELIRAMHQAAVNGSVPAAKFITSYVDGTPAPMNNIPEHQSELYQHFAGLAYEIREAAKE
jgi:hypothetical protein